jgi:alkanesulfonate monooxygenase SsuD/methylene tetrahydromethanopterin reductase-like flavin-dependent oxidoreductase (luciferase family)
MGRLLDSDGRAGGRVRAKGYISMKTDVLLVPMSARYADMRAAAIAADEAGFDGLWTWDHLRDPDDGGGPGVPEAWTVLSALAEVTGKIALGPLVLNVATRHPGLLANMAATLQAVSRGRLLLGIGAGGSRRTPYAREQEALGLAVEPDAARAQRVVEAIEVMRRLWAGDSAGFTGDRYRLDRPTGFLRPDPPPPVIVGGFGPRMAAIAGRHAEGFNTQAFHPQLSELVTIARDAHAAAGRDPARFIVTVFAGFEERWLTPGARGRQMLERVGVDRVILLLSPPFDLAAIRRAQKHLSGRG